MPRTGYYWIALCLIGPCFAQGPESATATLTSAGGVAYDASFSFQPVPFENALVVAAPYSAEEVARDGEQLRLLRKVYRSGKGAIRIERPLNLGPNVENAPLVIEISDFETGYQYVLDTQSKIAHRYKPPVPGTEALTASEPAAEPAVAVAGGAGATPVAQEKRARPQGPQIATLTPPTAPQLESVGTSEVNGLRVEVRRSAASEVWFSPELQVMVLSKTIGPQGVERTVGLQKIARTEPDPRLFQIPPDYKMQDERGEFRIRAVIAP